MKPRRQKSRKRSAASSTAKRLEQAIFYLDECIYSKLLLERMRAIGARVEHAGGAFPRGIEDQVYLTHCGRNGWIVLTRDQRIRRRPLERAALRAAGVAAFAFTAGQATAEETAQAIVPLLEKMANIAISETKPFLYIFGITGRLTRVPGYELR
jgi:hypothetical protein